MTGAKSAPALRERARRAVRVEPAAVAMRPFAEHGCEAAAVDRAAGAVRSGALPWSRSRVHP